jgi:hypothetical protein
MDKHLESIILESTGAHELFMMGTIQSLWSGYGSIDRYGLVGSELGSVIVKHVRLPERGKHPRGWNTDKSHQRKLRSYQVESAWYRQWAQQCGDDCRIPRCLALEQRPGEFLMVLEDLDSSGYPVRKDRASGNDITSCLKWLASFHATFMEERPEGLWKTGTYWHLKTRPDELKSMPEGDLKQAASALDRVLSSAPYPTFVHGDAKLANFCFSARGSQVAAVDFQYVGGGCGMKDVAYFISSCLNEHECERREKALLNTYFSALKEALTKHRPQIDAAAVEAAWRPLYAVAWTDFYRFLQGWSPGHWKIHGYSERLAAEVLGRVASA